MIPKLRNKYNREFSQSAYRQFLNDLDSSVGYPTDFRVSETPVFLTPEITFELINAGNEIITSLRSDEFKEHSKSAVPEKLNVAGEDSHPCFMQIDYAICEDEKNKLVPRLIELQGFPSLYAYQYLLGRKISQHFQIPDNFTSFFSGLDNKGYEKLLRKIILGDKDPANVILMEIDPANQKTRIDFAETERITGIRTVDIQDIYQSGEDLFYNYRNKEIKIERIYNRVIFDELQRKKISINFNIFDTLNVQWAGHPNWFFRISKHSLPFLKNEYNPDCYFLDEKDNYPDDLENYVLKPLYSFAGHGVEIDLTKGFLDSINDRKNYILQQKINYAPIIETPDEPAKVEIRMMYLWKDEPVLVNNLVRMSKGKMMGVDYNKNKTWIGSSIAFHKK
ncbi:MAG TPA: hypothetical protein VJ954_09920 [Ignavibacteriaceae bacterium]|nr:hypothetical protein [Ignavibacteriaceae bacterium]